MHSAIVPASVLPDTDDPVIPPWRENSWMYFINTDIANHVTEYTKTLPKDFRPQGKQWDDVFRRETDECTRALLASPFDGPPEEAGESMVVDEEFLEFLRGMARDLPYFDNSKSRRFRNIIWKLAIGTNRGP